MKFKGLMIALAAVLLLAGCTNPSTDLDNTSDVVKEINVYTSRHYDVDDTIIQNYKDQTGVQVNLVELKSDEIVAKLTLEKSNTPADLVIMNGAENIYKIQQLNLLQDHGLTDLDAIDDQYVGSQYVALTRRARIVMHANAYDGAISSYADLADDSFTGRILVRSSSNTYNQALVASMIQLYGEEYTAQWIRGIVDNFGREPQGNDRDQVKGVAAGEGDVAIVNSYYLYRLNTSSEAVEVEASQAVQADSLNDVHENISWIGMIRTHDAVQDFVEYLLSAEVQAQYAQANGEYPVRNDVDVVGIIADLPDYSYQSLDFESLGQYLETAYQLMLENGWN